MQGHSQQCLLRPTIENIAQMDVSSVNSPYNTHMWHNVYTASVRCALTKLEHFYYNQWSLHTYSVA